MNRKLNSLKLLLQVFWRLLTHGSEIRLWFRSVRMHRCIYVNKLGQVLPVGFKLPYRFLTGEEMGWIDMRCKRSAREQGKKFTYLH